MSVRQKVSEFLHEVRSETAKVSWPTRTETRQATMVVLVAVALLTVVIFVMDQVFVFLIGLLFG